mmetsp:Transcript_18763/g.28012  ORF Transcript_18763/g.28012 Transcript_18763/m.28012 type:complete len:270 (-) Transcript_18763:265-1074(-)
MGRYSLRKHSIKLGEVDAEELRNLPYVQKENSGRNAALKAAVKKSTKNASDSDSDTDSEFSLVSVEPSTTAVILIEFQHEFAGEGGEFYSNCKPCMDKYQVLENAEALMKQAREAGCKIIHVPIAFTEKYKEIDEKFIGKKEDSRYGVLDEIADHEAFQESGGSADFIDAMKPVDGDLICAKKGLCAFFGTDLGDLLEKNGIDTIILAGFLTNCCIESTMRTAYEKGYKVITLFDCCGAASIDAHESSFKHSFEMFSIRTTSDLVEFSS